MNPACGIIVRLVTACQIVLLSTE